MFGTIMSDNLMAALKPQVEKAIEPMFVEIRATLLTKIAGPPPAAFAKRARTLFAFSESDIQLLWEAACDSVL